jgi:carbonic anhydrase
MIGPGLRGLNPNLAGAARLSAAVEANVRWSMGQLAAVPAGQRLLEGGQLVLAGAVYDLETGRVRYLET